MKLTPAMRMFIFFLSEPGISLGQAAKAAGISKRWAIEIVKRLEDAGLIEVQRCRGRCSRYDLSPLLRLLNPFSPLTDGGDPAMRLVFLKSLNQCHSLPPMPTGEGSSPPPSPSKPPTGEGNSPVPLPSEASTGEVGSPAPLPGKRATGEGNSPVPPPSGASSGEVGSPAPPYNKCCCSCTSTHSKDKQQQKEEARRALVGRGVSTKVAERLVEQYSPQRILEVCRGVDGRKVRNKPGFIVRALQEGWNIEEKLPTGLIVGLRSEPGTLVRILGYSDDQRRVYVQVDSSDNPERIPGTVLLVSREDLRRSEDGYCLP